jgi:phosphate starvation-inducible PhoH-like protein
MARSVGGILEALHFTCALPYTTITTMKTAKLTLTPLDNNRLNNLCGEQNQNLAQIEQYLNVKIFNRGNILTIEGDEQAIVKTKKIIRDLYDMMSGSHLAADKLHLMLRGIKSTATIQNRSKTQFNVMVNTKKIAVIPHTKNQRDYIKNIESYDITFSIGPAGTGKTFLAVACAINALEKERVSRIILVRPAVEAGEKLGFLPGNIAEKVDPYLRPIYDALYETTGSAQIEKLIQNNTIEIAPLAFMRGRTLNSAFIILDESQNTTIEQMKMFLTRIGFGSKAVITGDITQIDLTRGQKSGLIHAMDILKDEKQISFNYFKSSDVVRHPLVQKIIEAYEREAVQ